MDLLRKKMTNLGGNSDGIGEQVIDGRQASAGPMSPRGHLDRGRFAGKHAKTIAARVSAQVDQDIDFIDPYTIPQLVVRSLRSVPPLISNISERSRHGILGRIARITNDLEWPCRDSRELE